MKLSQDWFILLVWVANAMIEGALVILATVINEEIEDGEWRFVMICMSAAYSLAQTVGISV